MARGRNAARARGRGAAAICDDWSRGRPDRFSGHIQGPLYDTERIAVASGAVSSMPDQRATGWDSLQATTAKRPTPSTINGRGAVLYNGTDQTLGRANGSTTTTLTVVFVFQRESAGSAIDQYMITDANLLMLLRRASFNEWCQYKTTDVRSGVAIPVGTPCVLAYTQRAANDVDFWFNGAKSTATNGTTNFGSGIVFAGSALGGSASNTNARYGDYVRLAVPPASVLGRIMKAYACKFRIAIAKV
jgi:hypothetical protein